MTKTSDPLEALLKQYATIERRFKFAEKDSKYEQLVTANTNQNIPVQRWFHLKEAYSLHLLEQLLSDWGIRTDHIHRILDPFCGVGTTLMASQKLAQTLGRHDIESIGIERNPFLHFATQTKIHWHDFDTTSLRKQTAHLMNGAVKPGSRPIPNLSTLRRTDIFEPQVLELVLGFYEAIQRDVIEPSDRAPLLLGYASVLEDVSGVRKDGRALRVQPNKQRSEVRPALQEAWDRILSDISAAPAIFRPIRTQAYLGDGRTLSIDAEPSPALGLFDVIMFSPPYLNNIDYTEVYKLELWLSGFIDTQEEFKNQRLRTMRSHPSVRFPDPVTMSADPRLQRVSDILHRLIESLPRDQYFAARSRIFMGYFDDMYRSLQSQIQVLNPGGWIFCVVGNSLHGSADRSKPRIPVASDLLIAVIAKAIGLDVMGIQVARHLTRRSPGSHYLRESILAMRKPS